MRRSAGAGLDWGYFIMDSCFMFLSHLQTLSLPDFNFIMDIYSFWISVTVMVK